MESPPLDQRIIAGKGKELSDAYYAFAPAWMRRQFHEQREANSVEGRAASLPENADKLGLSEFSRLFVEQIQKARKAIAEPEITSEMRDHLIGAMRRGAVRVYGVPQRPTPGHDYVEIPLAMLEPRFVKWSQNVIEDRNFTFRSVRVLRSSKSPMRRDAATRSHAAAYEPSNPSAETESLGERRRRLVIAAFEQIPEAVKKGKSQKAKIEAVKQQLVGNKIDFKNGRGLSNERIREHLQDQFDF